MGDSQVRHSIPAGELMGFVAGALAGPHGTAPGRPGVLSVADTANGIMRKFILSEDHSGTD